jgi:inner membrane protein
MPTIFSHPVVPLTIAIGLGSTAISPRLLLAGVMASIAPDLDVIAFRLGIAYAHDLGHRGISHSFFFAVLLALAAVPFSHFLRSTRKTVFLFVLVGAASHGALDMLTNGGLGVAYFWPFSSERLFFPCQVIAVSPLSLQRLLSPIGLLVLKSELMWLWMPAAAMVLLALIGRKISRMLHN